MKREEAIRIFEGIIDSLSISIAQADFFPSKAELNELCNMAIEALQGDMYCPNCGVRLVQEDEYLEPTQTHGRLIDADALSKKLCETTIFIKDGKVFQRMINDAPIVPVVDITQRDLCKDISCEDCPFMQETCKLMDYVAYADRPHGVWEYTEVTTDDDTYSEWVCSECGGSGYELMDFCPWCGCAIDKGENK